MAFSVPATHTLDKAIAQALDASATVQAHELGYVVKSETGRWFQYVHLSAANKKIESGGYPAYWMSGTSDNYVGSDVSVCQESDGTDGPIQNAFAGVFCCAVAATHGLAKCFLWIQTKGYVPSASTSGVTAQEGLKAATDNYFSTYDASLEVSSHVVAYALESTTNDHGDIMLLGR